MSVSVGSLSVSGEWSTIKGAKKIAALRMLNLIENGSDEEKSKVKINDPLLKNKYQSIIYFFPLDISEQN
jgi:hypothetical protein